MIPTRDEILQRIGIPDYALAGKIFKDLAHSEEVNGAEFAEEVVREIGRVYETGFHKGFTGWQLFKRINTKDYEKARWGMWKKVCQDASWIVCGRNSFKPIGCAATQATEEILERAMLNAGMKENLK